MSYSKPDDKLLLNFSIKNCQKNVNYLVEITIEVEADGTMSSSTTFVTKYDFRLGSSVPVEDFIEYAQKGGKEACWTIDLEKH